MDKSILDASVVIKWFVKEQDRDKAITYLTAFQNNEVVLIFPSLLFYELGNVLIKKKATIGLINEVMVKFQQLNLLGLEIQDIGLLSFRQIYQNSIEYSLTFYDAAYLTLMQKENCQFVTADRKLFEKVHKNFKAVKLLSDLF